jgi:hypothetical protein
MVELLLGDCLTVLASRPADSVDAVVTDPPYGMRFMGAAWDGADIEASVAQAESLFRARRAGDSAEKSAAMKAIRSPTVINSPAAAAGTYDRSPAANLAFQAWCQRWAAAALRVTKPGGYLLAFGGTRTFHRLACALEGAGWEMRDTLCWLYGCLSEDTELLTSKGWVHYRKITTADHALAYDPARDAFGWERIQEVVTYDYSDTAFRVHSDRTDQIVSRNHRCLVERGGAYAFCFAEDAARQREAGVPVLEDVSGLLATVPLPDQGTGGTEQDVRAEVRGGEYLPAADGTANRVAGAENHDRLRALWENPPRPGEACRPLGAHLLQPLLPVEGSRRHAPASLREHEGARAQGQTIRAGEPFVEGGSYLLQPARELRQHEVCSLPGRVLGNGPQGRVRCRTPLAGSAGVGSLPDQGRDGSPRGPQPDQQRLGESVAVRVQPRPQAVRGARFAATDLARVTPFHYRGVVWCIRVPSGAFVARRNGKVFVTGNSGFPKGQGCLKPAWEPILLCRRPGPRVLPLGIDGCRVATEDRYSVPQADFSVHAKGQTNKMMDRTHGEASYRNGDQAESHPAGRWPANVVLSIPEDEYILKGDVTAEQKRELFRWLLENPE